MYRLVWSLGPLAGGRDLLLVSSSLLSGSVICSLLAFILALFYLRICSHERLYKAGSVSRSWHRFKHTGRVRRLQTHLRKAFQ
jgi:hypothetical protein